MAAKQIFIAFTGPSIDQLNAVHKIADGFECWNLKTLDCGGFVSAIQGVFLPVNETVLKRHHETSPDESNDIYGITKEQYEACSWGLLLPDRVRGAIVAGYPEILFLLNLYSPHFLRPVFYVSASGICRPGRGKVPMLYFHDQNQAYRFKREEFVTFYDALISESVYGAWQADRMAKWNKEDWRLFVACLLFSELKAYENSKEVFTWQRESADMATILEALFTAGSGEQTEVGYRLRKRIAALIGFWFPDIERAIKELYKQRSAFVHGSFFLDAKKDIQVRADGFATLPTPPFQSLYKHKECIRQAMIAYLYLNKVHRADNEEFAGCKNVMDILETSIIDLRLRAKVQGRVEHILSLVNNQQCGEIGSRQTAPQTS
jgi:hypothetical protein